MADKIQELARTGPSPRKRVLERKILHKILSGAMQDNDGIIWINSKFQLVETDVVTEMKISKF